MHYLEDHFDSALGKVISQIVPNHKYMSVHDLFNPELFHQCLINTINNIPELSPYAQTLNLPTMLRQGDSGPQSGYIEQRMHNFTTICEIINDAFDGLNLPLAKMGKEALFRLVKQYDLDELQLLIEQLFQLMIRNREVVQFITTLAPEDQFSIKDFLQKAKARQDNHLQQQALKKQDQDEKNKLNEENQELRNLLTARQNQLEQATHQIHQYLQQIAEFRETQSQKQSTIQSLKRRLLAYQQTDSLFQEKDQEIFKLNRQLGELQIAHRLLSTELKTEKQKLGNRVNQLERMNSDLQTKCQKLINSYQALNRQRQDTDASNKRVIQNLRDRLKSQTDHANSLHSQLVEAKIGKQLRQRQFLQLMSNFQSLKSQSSEIISKPRNSAVDNLLMNSSSGHGKQILRLQQQLNEIDKLQENDFQDQIMMFSSGQDNLKKVQDIIAENTRLKEKLNSQENRGGKQFRDENQKLRKRLAIMKKRNEQLQSQKRQELQLLISAFDGIVRFN